MTAAASGCNEGPRVCPGKIKGDILVLSFKTVPNLIPHALKLCTLFFLNVWVYNEIQNRLYEA